MADTRLGPAGADSELAPASSFIGGDLALEGHGSALDVLGGPLHQAHALTIGMLSDASANVAVWSTHERATRRLPRAHRPGRQHRHHDPQGRLVFGIFAALAEFERELIRERTIAGLSSARARGRKGGRPYTMTPAAAAGAGRHGQARHQGW
jgi:hypothetical protein